MSLRLNLPLSLFASVGDSENRDILSQREDDWRWKVLRTGQLWEQVQIWKKVRGWRQRTQYHANVSTFDAAYCARRSPLAQIVSSVLGNGGFIGDAPGKSLKT